MQNYTTIPSEHHLLAGIKRHARALLLAAVVVASATQAHAQGCVAIKQMGDGTCSLDGLDVTRIPEKWNLVVSYQHFRSHRHFSQSDQNFSRYYLGSEVVNNVDQTDVSLGYRYNAKTSVTVGLPYFSASRSSLYEHDGVHRGTTNAQGIGDVRMSVARWLSVVDRTVESGGCRSR